MSKNNSSGLRQIRAGRIRRFREPLGVATVDEDGEAAGPSAGADVAPPIADHVAARQIDVVFARGVEPARG